MHLHILRNTFLFLTAIISVLSVLQKMSAGRQIDYPYALLIVGMMLGVAGFLVAIDIFIRRKRLVLLLGVAAGLATGLLLAFALGFGVDLVGVLALPPYPRTSDELERATMIGNLLQGVKVFVGLAACYFCLAMVLQCKGDLRFIIPYVEFTRQIRGTRPILLDTSVIVDGRMAGIIDTQVVQGSLVVPRFVLNELHRLANSPNKIRRLCGRRGLQVLQKLQDNRVVEVTIDGSEADKGAANQKLVDMALHYEARIMTNDCNLSRVAAMRGVKVINLNDLAEAMRAVVLPGETIRIKIIRPGESANQGVGYLEDGTMVVVEDGRLGMHQEIEVVVISAIQTSGGRMIFGRHGPDETQTATGRRVCEQIETTAVARAGRA